MKNVDAAKEKFGKLIFSELERIEDIKEQQEFIDFKKLFRFGSRCTSHPRKLSVHSKIILIRNFCKSL